MKTFRIFAMISVLALAILACQVFSGGSNSPSAPSSDTPSSSSNPGSAGEGGNADSAFPMTSDAYNITDVGDGSVLYYTKLSRDDVMKFYRDTYTSKGYKEREALTVVSDKIFNIVFDGDPSGKAIVIQSVDLGDGSRTISIRLEVIQ